MPVKLPVKTIKQTSSGGVIHRVDQGRVQVALINVSRGRNIWALPKGRVEAGEKPEETAEREVREETGLHGDVLAKIGDIKYWFMTRVPPARHLKTVHFYLLRFTSGSTDDHDREAVEASWFDAAEAERVLSYENERKILKSALMMIQERA
jgi:8-oxo-dGTP pyrophosphatase MutT (NUDIX family)